MDATNYPLSPRKAVFFHVMKTGGMTFRQILASIYGQSFHVCDDPSIEAVGNSLAKHDCIEFHTLPFQGDFVHMHAELVEQNRLDLLDGCDVFTMLREPVEQVVSQYFYTLKKRAFIEPTYKVNGIPFPSSLEEYLEGPYHFNNQLAFLLAKYPLTSASPLTRDDLTAAKQMLLRLRTHVGLTERFADSLHIFEQVTGRRVPGQRVLNQNTNPDRPPLEAVPARILDGIRERSALDLELYEFARELFLADFDQYGSSPKYTFIDPNAETTKSPQTRDEVVNSARSAISYLVASQLPDGEFQTEFCYDRHQTEDGQTVEDLMFDSSPFVTSIVLDSLEHAKALDPRIEKTVAKGVKFLVSEMDPGGLWRYWTRKNPRRKIIPPDLDDTACISHLLQAHGVSIPKNQWLFYDSRDKRGAFYTWLFKADSPRKWLLWLKTGGKAFTYTEELWQWTKGDDVCAVVNANALLYLGETEGTQKAIEYLLNIFRDGTEDKEIVFYAHPMSLYYFASRALFKGVKALSPAKQIMRKKILSLQQLDGSFGDELLTGLAICALVNLEERPEELDRAVEYLLSTQRQDGSWKRVPMYGGPPTPTTFGSADLTTGICLEALARWSSGSGK